MVEYPTDLELNSSMDIQLDAGNDLATTSGVSQLEQSVAIDVRDEITDFVGGRLEGGNIGLLEERIKRGLNDDPQISTVRSINITEFNRQTNEVTVEVFVAQNNSFTLTVST